MSNYTNKPSYFGSVEFWQRRWDDSCGENSLQHMMHNSCSQRHVTPTPYLCQFILLHTKLRLLFHPPTLSHHGPIYTALYIQHSPIWNSLPCPSVLIYSDLFPTTWHAKSSARLSHSFPFPHTVCATIMSIIISYHDICIF